MWGHLEQMKQTDSSTPSRQDPYVSPPHKLVLEDGMAFAGRGFGADRAVAGEVVFNTGMSGYVEALTDPSYRGQILTLTYPLIGNYGVPAPRATGTIDGPYESDRIQVSALVVQNYVHQYSHVTAARSLGGWLAAEGIPAIMGIDTRTLTRHLREHGTMRGNIQPAGGADNIDEIDMTGVIADVSPDEISHYGSGEPNILLIDVGSKDNIVRSLLARNVSVTRAGCRSNIRELAGQADGVIISNGPGDPKDAKELIDELRDLMADYRKPIFGICLGNQLMALAAGADTYKLDYGHRGVNQPVQDVLTRRCYITSQNHGYAVRDDTLPSDWEPWFVNINDGTNEGIRSLSKPFFSVQFHPEASPGPRDTAYLFDDFLHLVQAIKRV